MNQQIKSNDEFETETLIQENTNETTINKRIKYIEYILACIFFIMIIHLFAGMCTKLVVVYDYITDHKLTKSKIFESWNETIVYYMFGYAIFASIVGFFASIVYFADRSRQWEIQRQ